ncbi:MAG: thioredoxin family protein [Chloroflexota bacterium]
MNRKILFVLAVTFMLACNFLLPTPAPQPTKIPQPTEAMPPATESIPEPTRDVPPTDPGTGLIGYTEIRLHPDDGDLDALLANAAAKAAALGQIPVVEFDAEWCPPCQAINKALADGNELMLKAYDGVYLIKLDVDEWGWGVDGFQFSGIPVYFRLDSQGQWTGEVIDGGAWNEDIPENIAPVMDEFFHTQK